MCEVQVTKLNSVWRVIDKFKNAVFRLGINLYNVFKVIDPYGKGLISEYNFRKVCFVLLKEYIPLSNTEVNSLVEYFKSQDGLIYWEELCDRIHDRQEGCGTIDYVTGNEWDDHRQRNALPTDLEDNLNILLEKISQILIMQDSPIDIYFKEYEKITKNPGCVSWDHLDRLLKAMNILLTQRDFNVLVRRYSRQNYLFNYIPFLEDLTRATERLRRKIGHSILIDYKFLVDTQARKHLRPDLFVPWKGRGLENGKPVSYRLLTAYPYKEEGPIMTMKRIKNHVFTNGINLVSLFRDFDERNTGLVKMIDFRRILSNAGINSGINSKLHFVDEDIETLIQIYKKPFSQNEFMWPLFVADVENALVKNTITSKLRDSFCDSLYLSEQGNVWEETPEEVRTHCEEVVSRLRKLLSSRGLNLKQFFEPYDKSDCGHVDILFFRNILTTHRVVEKAEDFDALEKRYTSALGFNYLKFLDELRIEDRSPPEELVVGHDVFLKEDLNVDPCHPPEKPDEAYSDALIRIRKKALLGAAFVEQFMRQFDPNIRNLITCNEFTRALTMAGIFTTKEDADLVCQIFQSSINTNEVEYDRFLRVIREAQTQPYLEKNPLLIPVKHVNVIDDSSRNLNAVQRRYAAEAIDILSDHFHMINYDDFKNFDKSKAGDLFRNQFIKLLDYFKVRLTDNHIDALFIAFGRKNVNSACLEYLPLLRVLDTHYRDKREI